MKTTQRIVGILLALLLLVCPALAEVRLTSEVVSSEVLRLNIQHAEVGEQGDVSLLYYNSLGDANKEAITLRVAGQNVPLSNIERYNGGTAWVLMVDTATVGTDRNDEPVRNTLRQLIENMGPSDEVAIIKTGDTGGNYDLEMRDYYLDNDAKRLKEAYGKLKINDKVTNMYQTMGVALDFLTAQNSSYRHTTLVVVSSGGTENQTNMSYDDLKAKIGSSKTTVYTVAYKKDDDNTNRLERFSSLAQASCGGFGVRERYNEDADAVTKDINENERCFFTATANPSEDITEALQGMQGETLESAVKALDEVKDLALCSANGVESAWPIDEEQWNLIRSKINIEPTPPPPPIPQTPWEKIVSFLKDNLTVVIACIAAVILLAIVLVVFSRRGKKPEDVPPTPAIEDNGPPDVPEDLSHKDRDDSGEITDIVTEKMIVEITQVGDNSDSWAYEMKNDIMTFGRKSDDAKEKPDLAIKTNDKMMSRIHIQLQYKEGRMIVRDMSSNGTKVNNKIVMRPTALHQQDILTMGENDYRIVWWRK